MIDHNFVPLKEEYIEEDKFSTVRESLLIFCKKVFYGKYMFYCFDGIKKI